MSRDCWLGRDRDELEGEVIYASFDQLFAADGTAYDLNDVEITREMALAINQFYELNKRGSDKVDLSSDKRQLHHLCDTIEKTPIHIFFDRKHGWKLGDTKTIIYGIKACLFCEKDLHEIDIHDVVEVIP